MKEEQTIKLDGKYIVVHDTQNPDVIVDTDNADDISSKLKQFNDEQISVLLQMIDDHKDKMPDIFKIMVNGIASQKNVVHGSVNATTARIGDEFHYHFYPKRESKLPKKLTLDIPKVPTDAIIGRQKELGELRQLLLEKQEALLLNGFGGIGKTYLVQVYTQKFWEEYNHIIWITLNPNNSFVLDFINTTGLKENLGIKTETNDPEEIFNDIIRKLNAIEEKPNLLILDNADEKAEDYKDRLPSSPRWHVLLTSRQEINGFTSKYLDFLNIDEAFLLFKKYYTLSALTYEQIKELIKSVDYHTLTIEILAKTANYQRYPFEKLKGALSHDVSAGLPVSRAKSKGRIDKITSFLCSVYSMSKLDENEIWLMQQMVCLPSEYHPYNLLENLIQPEKNNMGDVFAPIMNNLVEKGWLLKNIETDSFKLHLVVAEVIKRKQAPGIALLNNLIDNVSALLEIDQTKDNPIDKFQWVPFGKGLLKIIEEQVDKTTEEENKIALLQNSLALVLKDLGDYEGAKTLLQKAMLSAEKNFGLEHPTTAVRYNNLAAVLQELGDYEAALELSGKAIGIFENKLPSGHPTVRRAKSIYDSIIQKIE